MKKQHKAKSGLSSDFRGATNVFIAYQATVMPANQISRQDFINRYGHDPLDGEEES